MPLGSPITTLPPRVAEDNEREESESGEHAVAFVAEQMKAGADEDAIVAGLAIFTAWRMARPSGIRPRKSPISGM